MKSILIFINYCTKDQPIVDKLKLKLASALREYENSGASVRVITMDDYCAGRWDEWMSAIAGDCDIMIPILTENSMYPEDKTLKYINDELRIGRKYSKNMVPFVFCPDIPGEFDAHIGGMSQVWYVDSDGTDGSYDEVVRKVKLLIGKRLAGERVEQVSTNTLIGVPSATVNKFFVGREEELEKIHYALSENNVLILRGEGGIGKTSLAEAYFAKHRDLYTRSYVVNAKDGLVRCITDLPFDGHEHIKNESDKYRASIKKLGSFNEKTIIIFDNCDGEIEHPGLSDIKNTRCRYIITSRDGGSDTSDTPTLTVGKMPYEGLLDLVYSRYPDICEDNGKSREEMNRWLKELFEYVDGHTLAVELACAVMRDADEPIENIKTALFECRDKVAKANGATASAFDSLSVLYDFARLTDTEHRILRTLSMICPSVGIDRRALKSLLSLDTLDDIRSLSKRTFIREDKRKLSMHPLLSDVYYKKERPELTHERESVLEYLDELEREKTPASLLRAAMMIDHLICKRAAMAEGGTERNSMPDLATRAGSHLFRIGNLEGSLRYYLKALGALDESHSTSAQAIAKAKLGAGAALTSLAGYGEALEYLKAACDLAEEISDRMMCAAAHMHSGSAYMALSDHGRALSELNLAADTYTLYDSEAGNELGTCYGLIGGVYSRTGDFEAALSYYERALAIYESRSTYGGESLEIADLYINMGVTNEKLGKYSEAIKYHTEAGRILSNIYGDILHPRSADVLCHLGNAYRKSGLRAEALSALTEAMRIYAAIYPENMPHPRMADTENNIGNVLLSEGRCAEALGHYERALQACRRIYGDKLHPKTANALFGIGKAHLKNNDVKRAKESFCEALRIRKAVLHPSHEKIRETEELIAVCEAKA